MFHRVKAEAERVRKFGLSHLERLKKLQKNAVPVDWKQHLRSMRDEAIGLGFQPPEPANPARK